MFYSRLPFSYMRGPLSLPPLLSFFSPLPFLLSVSLSEQNGYLHLVLITTMHRHIRLMIRLRFLGRRQSCSSPTRQVLFKIGFLRIDDIDMSNIFSREPVLWIPTMEGLLPPLGLAPGGLKLIILCILILPSKLETSPKIGSVGTEANGVRVKKSTMILLFRALDHWLPSFKDPTLLRRMSSKAGPKAWLSFPAG